MISWKISIKVRFFILQINYANEKGYDIFHNKLYERKYI